VWAPESSMSMPSVRTPPPGNVTQEHSTSAAELGGSLHTQYPKGAAHFSNSHSCRLGTGQPERRTMQNET
jgi:hypothetical protein